jgi:hypothetical protein
MSPRDELYVAARTALLDALEALADHRQALILVGAQAIYVYTGEADVAIATKTEDGDVAIDPNALDEAPRTKIDEVMMQAGFSHNLKSRNPGEWLSPAGVRVDLLAPASLTGSGSQRGARMPPHGKRAARRVDGLEPAIIDNELHEIVSFSPEDTRSFTIKVARPTALLVAKLYKLADPDRQKTPRRLLNKDAHDIYRLMRAVELDVFEAGFQLLRGDALTKDVTEQALGYLRELFSDPSALGPRMAGETEVPVGDPDVVAAASHALAQDILAIAGLP